MQKIVSLFKNIKNSPQTTFVGSVFMLLGVFIMDKTGYEDLSYNSISVILFVVGGYLIVSRDGK